ncbi:MAG: hypothetical protein ACI8TX_003582 [Hyphomicrobiaceae bacterium]|jgi:hypothetical protein
MKKIIGLAVACTFVAGFAVNAQADDEVNVTLGAAASYTFDVNDPDPTEPGNGSENNAAYSNYEQDESFNIDLVQVGINGTRGPVTYGVKLNFGDLAANAGDARDSDGFEDSSDSDVGLQEAFLSIDASGLTVTAGRFGTPIGYEVLEPWGNSQISRSRAWNSEPVAHDGLAVSGSTGNVSGMLGVVNGFNVQDFNANNVDDEYGILGAFGANFGNVDVNLAAIYSEEADAADVFEISGIVASVIGNCNLALEVVYLDADDDGNTSTNTNFDSSVALREELHITGYGDLHYGPWVFGMRASWLDSETPGISSSSKLENEIWTVSVTAGYEITEGVLVRAEYRHDGSDDDIFGDDDFSSSGLSDSLDVLQAQILWMP